MVKDQQVELVQKTEERPTDTGSNILPILVRILGCPVLGTTSYVCVHECKRLRGVTLSWLSAGVKAYDCKYVEGGVGTTGDAPSSTLCL